MGTLLLIDPDRGADPTDIKVQRALWAQRAYPKAQELLGATTFRPLGRPFTTTWHDLGLSEYPGAFALVNEDADDLAGLVGGVVRVTLGRRSTLVMIIGSDQLDEDISLARRAYLDLAPLNYDPALASIGVVREP